ncbi:hypothetical protein DITRI_Ditri09bG0058000 [Diplodiscus trichospermus]
MSDNLIFGKVAALCCGTLSWCCCNGLAKHTIISGAAALLAAALTIAYYARWVKKFNKNIPPLPPGPPGLPILGNLPFLQSDLHRYFSKLSQIYGPIIKLQLGSKICIVINSASVAKEVLKDNDAIFANRDPPAAAIVGSYGGSDIAWRSHGPELHKLRRLVRESVSNTRLDGCYLLRRREVREMVKDIYGKVGLSPVNIGDQMFLTSLNVITSMLWGGPLHGEERSRLGIKFRQVVKEFVELLGAPNLSDLFPSLTRFDLQGVQSKMKKLSTWLDKFLESVIAQRKNIADHQSEGEPKDFLQLLLELNQKGDHKSSLSMNEIKALLVDIVVAGTDTTSNTVEWTMTELLRHPHKMRKVVEELDTVVGDQNIVEESHIPQLVYLDAVITETLRVHPPTPLLLPRKPSNNCTIVGYTIPKDCRVLVNVWAIQRDPEYWENPLEFEPERFLRDGAERDNYMGNNFNFLPFGSGRRICVGIPMAERMMKHVLATLLHSFEWKLPEGKRPEIEEKLGIVLKKTEPLVAIPASRLFNSEQYQ